MQSAHDDFGGPQKQPATPPWTYIGKYLLNENDSEIYETWVRSQKNLPQVDGQSVPREWVNIHELKLTNYATAEDSRPRAEPASELRLSDSLVDSFVTQRSIAGSGPPNCALRQQSCQ
jgi:hypothetical protein